MMMVARADECRPDWLSVETIDHLAADELDTLSEHLDHCDACRRRLDRQTLASDWWHETRVMLTESSAAITATTNETALQISAAEGRVARYELGFLRSSEIAGHLGRIDHYEVLGVLGRGGMGIVLKAHDPALNRPVAIKVLSGTLAAQGIARQRFIREAQAAAAIAHPHVIAIHAVAPGHDPPYFVMPLVAGESLQRKIDSVGALPIDEAVRVAHQVAEGLAAAHAQGLIHRDVKPANILLEPGTDRVVLTDFGLARAVDDATLTCTGLIAGTPQYMAPEQALGESLDARSDLFSLGSVLYTMVAGTPPFRAESTFGMLRKIAEHTPQSLREANASCPLWLERLVAKLMAKDRRLRYPDAKSVADDLCAALAHLRQPVQIPLPAHLLVEPSGAQQSGHRPRWQLIVGACVIAAVMVVASIPLWINRPEQPQTNNSNPTTQAAAPLGSSAPPPPNAQPKIDNSFPWQDPTQSELQEIDQALRRLEASSDF